MSNEYPNDPRAQRIADRMGEVLSRPEPLTTYSTAAELKAVAENRRQIAKIEERQSREMEVLETYSRPFASDTTNPYTALSQSELLELSRLEQQEAAQKAELEKQFTSFASWSLLNTSAPATPAFAQTVVEWVPREESQPGASEFGQSLLGSPALRRGPAKLLGSERSATRVECPRVACRWHQGRESTGPGHRNARGDRGFPPEESTPYKSREFATAGRSHRSVLNAAGRVQRLEP